MVSQFRDLNNWLTNYKLISEKEEGRNEEINKYT